MTADDYAKVIEAALAMKPTPGPWYVRTNRHTDTDGRAWGWLDAAPPGGGQANIRGIQATWTRGDRSEANIRFIAACHPEALHALLEERKAMKRHILRALEAWDTTPLPASGDGMLQERMEDLRAYLTTTADSQPETGKE